MEQIMQCKT